MNVLVFSPYGGFTTFLATDLEIIEQHLVAGDQVSAVVCDYDLESCDYNEQHLLQNCLKCIGRRQSGHRQLSPGLAVVRLADLITPADRSRIERFDEELSTVTELESLVLDNFDIGYAVLSSIITLRRNPDIDVTAEAVAIGRMSRAAAFVYFGFLNLLRDKSPDRVYLFNGRMAPMRAALRACEREGIPVYVSEVGCDEHHYSLTENAFPHNIECREKDIQQLWEKSPHTYEQRVKIASDWFEARACPDVDKNRFIKSQQLGKLPEAWDDSVHNIACFTSSSDEFAAIGKEWKNPLFEDQEQGLKWILEQTASRAQDLHIYVRMHPNQQGVANEGTRQIRELVGPHFTIIDPKSPISSYTLAQAADTVLTFGSSLGIESVYWGTPSVLVGSCFYQNLEATYNPRSVDELPDLLSYQLEPKDREPALLYGYYFATFGKRFRYYQPASSKTGLFKGHCIRAPLLYRLGRSGLKVVGSLKKVARTCWPGRRAA
jgi:hypothetical protein